MAFATPLDAMIAAARSAGRVLLHHRGKVQQTSIVRKNRGDFVSHVDLTAEKAIARVLRAGYPDYGFLMEESGLTKGRDATRLWIVDPLDGTTNYLRGVPYFAVSIALRERGRIVAGVVLDPLRGEMFTARRGGGAFLNGKKIAASGRRQISEGLVVTGIPLLKENESDTFSGRLAALRASTGGIRSMGAAALDLAYVASGRYDAYWEEGQAPWDIAAGILLVEESGGRCTDSGGRASMLKSGNLLASNRHLHMPLLVALASHCDPALGTVRKP